MISACQRAAKPDTAKIESDALGLALLGMPTGIRAAVEHFILAILFAGGRAHLDTRIIISVATDKRLAPTMILSPGLQITRRETLHDLSQLNLGFLAG